MTDLNCSKCASTGWYKYDRDHSTVCDKCCKHDKGWWELSEHYYGYEKGANNNCCKAGCGTMERDLKVQK